MMKKNLLFTLFCLIIMTTNAQKNDAGSTINKDLVKNNPLVAEWKTPYETPPFSKIKLEHYKPAFEYAIATARQEVYQIAAQKSKPTFENTIVALDRSGKLLSRVSRVFYNLLSTMTSTEMQGLAQELSPMLTEYSNELYHNAALFSRVQAVYKEKDKLTKNEDKMLLEKTYKAFVNSGALLSEKDKETYNEISLQLSKLTLQFGENLLEATNEFEMLFTDKKELSGMPESSLAIAEAKAKEKGQTGYIFDLTAPSYSAIMKYADDRELRQKFYISYYTRALSGKNDNRDIIREIVSLRSKLANLMGFKTYADYVLQDRMAENPKNVYNLLDQLLEASLPVAQKRWKNSINLQKQWD